MKGSWKIRIKSAIKASSPSSILKATPRPPPSCKASAAVHVSLQLLQARQSPSTVTIVTLFLRQQSPLNRKSPFYSDRRLMTRAVAYARITSKVRSATAHANTACSHRHRTTFCTSCEASAACHALSTLSSTFVISTVSLLTSSSCLLYQGCSNRLLSYAAITQGENNSSQC